MAGSLGLKAFRALAARILFATHSLLAIWRLYMVAENILYWGLALIPVSLFVEGALTILYRNGDEYSWFCPSIFLFLAGSVPPIWLLELRSSWLISNNQTITSRMARFERLSFGGALELQLPSLPNEFWVQMIEQSLLVVLIVGRWILPKGNITHDGLSQLLLAYLAISSDIVEVFNIFQESAVRRSFELSLILLTIWSVSLVQFPLVVTTMKSQKARYCWNSGLEADSESVCMENSACIENNESRNFLKPSMYGSFGNISTSKMSSKSMENIPVITVTPAPSPGACSRCTSRVCKLSVWGIMSTVVLQDGPFLGYRVYLIFWKGIMSYTMFFFVCKNTLITLVQIYRLFVICLESPNKQLRFAPSVSSIPAATRKEYKDYECRIKECDSRPESVIVVSRNNNNSQTFSDHSQSHRAGNSSGRNGCSNLQGVTKLPVRDADINDL